MAKLTTSKRASLPSKDFAGPGRSFPIPDKSHARAALMLEKNAPASARPKIEAKAKAMLGGGGTMSAKQDAKYDKVHGIKAGSAADKRMDKKLMGGGGIPRAGTPAGGSKPPAPKFPAARPFGSKSPNGGAKAPTKGGSKGPSGRAIQGPSRGGGGKKGSY